MYLVYSLIGVAISIVGLWLGLRLTNLEGVRSRLIGGMLSGLCIVILVFSCLSIIGILAAGIGISFAP